ncbi:uncharacterized protein LOC144770864 isoform X2 [Lissotriton helveticus]
MTGKGVTGTEGGVTGGGMMEEGFGVGQGTDSDIDNRLIKLKNESEVEQWGVAFNMLAVALLEVGKPLWDRSCPMEERAQLWEGVQTWVLCWLLDREPPSEEDCTWLLEELEPWEPDPDAQEHLRGEIRALSGALGGLLASTARLDHAPEWRGPRMLPLVERGVRWASYTSFTAQEREEHRRLRQGLADLSRRVSKHLGARARGDPCGLEQELAQLTLQCQQQTKEVVDRIEFTLGSKRTPITPAGHQPPAKRTPEPGYSTKSTEENLGSANKTDLLETVILLEDFDGYSTKSTEENLGAANKTDLLETVILLEDFDGYSTKSTEENLGAANKTELLETVILLEDFDGYSTKSTEENLGAANKTELLETVILLEDFDGYSNKSTEENLGAANKTGNSSVSVGRNTDCNTTIFNFDMQFGTSTLMDYYWACGERLYPQLPPQWLGLCSLVTLHEVHLVVPASNAPHILSHPMTGDVTFLDRHRRTAEYFATEALGNVPEEFRLFNEAQLFFGGAVPMFQTQANARWLEVTCYEVMKVINSTRDRLNAIREELNALRLMVLEHRYFLDILTAKDGGLCHRIGKSCCTFIPGNDEDNGSIPRAIEELTNLGKEMTEEGGAPADFIPTDWFDFGWMPSCLQQY